MNQKFLGLILLTATSSYGAGTPDAVTSLRPPSPAALLAAATIAGAASTAGPEMPVEATIQPRRNDRLEEAARREARYARAVLLAAATPKAPARPKAHWFPKNGFRLNRPGPNSVLNSGRSKEKQQRSPRK